jgi:carboxyl-terminal processing protease
VAQSKEQAKYIATSAMQYTEAAYGNALDADEGKVRRSAHAVQEVPPEDFDTKTGDFELTRALDVLKYNGDVKLAAAHPRGAKLADSDLVDKPGAKIEAKMKATTPAGAVAGDSSSSASSSSSSSSSASSSSAEKK